MFGALGLQMPSGSHVAGEPLLSAGHGVAAEQDVEQI
jgi:hypothetical protein